MEADALEALGALASMARYRLAYFGNNHHGPLGYWPVDSISQ